MVGAGSLDRRVTIEQVAATRDAFGAPVEVWTVLATVWARREDILDRERFAAGGVHAPRRTRWIVRQSTVTLAMTPKHRLVDAGGGIYEIDGIRETNDGRGRFLEISTVTDLAAAIATANAMSGAISAALGVAGDLRQTHVLAGNISAALGVTGNLSSGEVALAGSISAVLGASGDLHQTHVLAGDVSTAASIVGDLGQAHALAGSITAVAGVSGDLSSGIALAGSIAAALGASGDLHQTHALAGSVSSAATIAGDLHQAHALAGVISAVSGVAGDLTQTHALAGTISAVADVAGDITVGAGASPDAMFSGLTVQAGGWDLDATVVGVVAGGTYSGHNNKAAGGMVLEVSSKSWTSAGVETTITRQVYGLCVTRQEYPDHASLEETVSGSDILTTYALSQRIYSGDTINKVTFLAGFFTDDGAGGAADSNLGGENSVTNSSTLAYYEPQACWMSPNLERITGTSYRPRLFVMHRAAQQGQPVRAVKFTATDESLNSVTETVSTLTTGQYLSSGKTANWYEPDLDLSSLTDGELVTIDAVIYPWVGDSFTISTDAETYPSADLSVLKVLNDAGGTFGTVYASVDGVGGGTPAVSTSAATADTTPYLSVGLAAAAIQTYNNANNSRNNLDGGVVRILAGASSAGFGAKLSNRTFGKGELLITGLNRATSKITDTGASSSNRNIKGQIRFENLTMEKLAGNSIFMDGANTLNNQIVLDRVSFLNTGGGSYSAWMYRVGREYFLNCDGDDCGQGYKFSTAVQGVATAVGCKWPMSAHNNVACGDGSTATIGNGTGLGVQKGQVFAFNFYTGSSTSNAVFRFKNIDVGSRGICLAGNVFETVGVTSQPALEFSADNDDTANINMIEAMNTVAGERSNLFYQDTGSVLVNKDGVSKHSVHQRRNIKGDVFATNGAMIGNWEARHRVDGGYSFYDLGDSAGNIAPGAATWLGEGLGDDKTEMAVGDVLTGNPDFADDQSGSGGAGNGDYAPGASTDIPQIPAGETMFAVDLFGTTIPADGTAYAGAVQ